MAGTWPDGRAPQCSADYREPVAVPDEGHKCLLLLAQMTLDRLIKVLREENEEGK